MSRAIICAVLGGAAILGLLLREDHLQPRGSATAATATVLVKGQEWRVTPEQRKALIQHGYYIPARDQ